MLAILLSVSISSCSDGMDEPQPPTATPQIIFLFSPGGLGDMSYNDCILEGVQQFKKQHRDVDLFLYSPSKIEESERIFSDWLDRPESDIPVLFVLASSDYENLAADALARKQLTSNKKVLVFESRRDFGEGTSSFQISMFGASFLAGATAASVCKNKAPLIVLANPSDSPISLASDGFNAGYGKDCKVEYLADDWTGYVAASLAYRRMGEWASSHDFIFPVAGGSNSGIYRYSREVSDCPFLAGVDVDQSALSNRIVGSVVKHIDRLVMEYLSTWLATGLLPESGVFGLESGYVDWSLSQRYRPEYETLVEINRPKAVEKEKEVLGL